MQVYLVGGAVRDELLGIKGSDRDYVVVGSSIEEMKALKYQQVGHDFPVFLHPTTHEEYALARTEKKNGVGYTGFICDFSPTLTLEEDLKRRDLTINAIAQDSMGNIIDPFNGVKDLNHKILRHVSEAFSEDPLRVLRVARFHAKLYHLGFNIAPQTITLMHKMAISGELKALTAERVFTEIQKALTTKNPEMFFYTLHEVGALKYILPEVDALYGVPGPIKWHPEVDTFVHTMMTLKAVSALTDDPKTRFAMLLHDIGKALTPKEFWPHHRKHNVLGLEPLKALCSRLRVPNDYADLAYVVVLYHNDFHNLQALGAKGIVRLFESIDAYRRENRLLPYLYCCKADFLGRKGFESLPFPRFETALEMFNLTKGVKAQEFVKRGLKGEQIGQAMHQRRIDILNEYIKTLPEGLLVDNTPPTPIDQGVLPLKEK